MTRMNNNQQALYIVEDRWQQRLQIAGEMNLYTYEALNYTWTLPDEKRFTNLEQVQAYIDFVLDHEDVKVLEGYPEDGMKVKPSRYANKAHHYNHTISLPDNVEFRREITVLHEIAHAFGGGGHGKRFLAAYFTLIRIVMSPELALLMNAELDREMEG